MRSLWTPPEPGNRFVSCERACVRASVRACVRRAQDQKVYVSYGFREFYEGVVSRLPFSLFGSGAFPFSLLGFCPFLFLELASKEFQANFQVSSHSEIK